jgi:hypothetical protein
MVSWSARSEGSMEGSDSEIARSLGLGKRTEKSREEEALPRLAPCACVARGESLSCELLGYGLACALDLFFFFS